MPDVNVWMAFVAGLVSFISPCCLPLYPSYLSYITGMTVQQLKDDRNQREVRFKTMTHTLAFILGFSAVFYSLGLGAGLFGQFFNDNRELIRQLSAILIMLMGLFLLGVFKPQFLMKERKLDMNGNQQAIWALLYLASVSQQAGRRVLVPFWQQSLLWLQVSPQPGWR